MHGPKPSPMSTKRQACSCNLHGAVPSGGAKKRPRSYDVHVRPEVVLLRDAIITTRRDIHMNPELSFYEKGTAAMVAARLHALGLEVTENVKPGHGVVGLLKGTRAVAGAPAAAAAGGGGGGGGGGGEAAAAPLCIALRADMDALPIQEFNPG